MEFKSVPATKLEANKQRSPQTREGLPAFESPPDVGRPLVPTEDLDRVDGIRPSCSRTRAVSLLPAIEESVEECTGAGLSQPLGPPSSGAVCKQNGSGGHRRTTSSKPTLTSISEERIPRLWEYPHSGKAREVVTGLVAGKTLGAGEAPPLHPAPVAPRLEQQERKQEQSHSLETVNKVSGVEAAMVEAGDAETREGNRTNHALGGLEDGGAREGDGSNHVLGRLEDGGAGEGGRGNHGPEEPGNSGAGEGDRSNHALGRPEDGGAGKGDTANSTLEEPENGGAGIKVPGENTILLSDTGATDEARTSVGLRQEKAQGYVCGPFEEVVERESVAALLENVGDCENVSLSTVELERAETTVVSDEASRDCVEGEDNVRAIGCRDEQEEGGNRTTLLDEFSKGEEVTGSLETVGEEDEETRLMKSVSGSKIGQLVDSEKVDILVDSAVEGKVKPLIEYVNGGKEDMLIESTMDGQIDPMVESAYEGKVESVVESTHERKLDLVMESVGEGKEDPMVQPGHDDEIEPMVESACVNKTGIIMESSNDDKQMGRTENSEGVAKTGDSQEKCEGENGSGMSQTKEFVCDQKQSKSEKAKEGDFDLIDSLSKGEGHESVVNRAKSVNVFKNEHIVPTSLAVSKDKDKSVDSEHEETITCSPEDVEFQDHAVADLMCDLNGETELGLESATENVDKTIDPQQAGRRDEEAARTPQSLKFEEETPGHVGQDGEADLAVFEADEQTTSTSHVTGSMYCIGEEQFLTEVTAEEMASQDDSVISATGSSRAKGSGSDSVVAEGTVSGVDVASARESQSDHTSCSDKADHQATKSKDGAAKPRGRDRERGGKRKRAERGGEDNKDERGVSPAGKQTSLKNAVGDVQVGADDSSLDAVVEEENQTNTKRTLAQDSAVVCREARSIRAASSGDIRDAAVKSTCGLESQTVTSLEDSSSESLEQISVWEQDPAWEDSDSGGAPRTPPKGVPASRFGKRTQLNRQNKNNFLLDNGTPISNKADIQPDMLELGDSTRAPAAKLASGSKTMQPCNDSGWIPLGNELGLTTGQDESCNNPGDAAAAANVGELESSDSGPEGESGVTDGELPSRVEDRVLDQTEEPGLIHEDSGTFAVKGVRDQDQGEDSLLDQCERDTRTRSEYWCFGETKCSNDIDYKEGEGDFQGREVAKSEASQVPVTQVKGKVVVNNEARGLLKSSTHGDKDCGQPVSSTSNTAIHLEYEALNLTGGELIEDDMIPRNFAAEFQDMAVSLRFTETEPTGNVQDGAVCCHEQDSHADATTASTFARSNDDFSTSQTDGASKHDPPSSRTGDGTSSYSGISSHPTGDGSSSSFDKFFPPTCTGSQCYKIPEQPFISHGPETVLAEAQYNDLQTTHLPEDQKASSLVDALIATNQERCLQTKDPNDGAHILDAREDDQVIETNQMPLVVVDTCINTHITSSVENKQNADTQESAGIQYQQVASVTEEVGTPDQLQPSESLGVHEDALTKKPFPLEKSEDVQSSEPWERLQVTEVRGGLQIPYANVSDADPETALVSALAEAAWECWPPVSDEYSAQMSSPLTQEDATQESCAKRLLMGKADPDCKESLPLDALTNFVSSDPNCSENDHVPGQPENQIKKDECASPNGTLLKVVDPDNGLNKRASPEAVEKHEDLKLAMSIELDTTEGDEYREAGALESDLGRRGACGTELEHTEGAGTELCSNIIQTHKEVDNVQQDQKSGLTAQTNLKDISTPDQIKELNLLSRAAGVFDLEEAPVQETTPTQNGCLGNDLLHSMDEQVILCQDDKPYSAEGQQNTAEDNRLVTTALQDGFLLVSSLQQGQPIKPVEEDCGEQENYGLLNKQDETGYVVKPEAEQGVEATVICSGNKPAKTRVHNVVILQTGENIDNPSMVEKLESFVESSVEQISNNKENHATQNPLRAAAGCIFQKAKQAESCTPAPECLDDGKVAETKEYCCGASCELDKEIMETTYLLEQGDCALSMVEETTADTVKSRNVEELGLEASTDIKDVDLMTPTLTARHDVKRKQRTTNVDVELSKSKLEEAGLSFSTKPEEGVIFTGDSVADLGVSESTKDLNAFTTKNPPINEEDPSWADQVIGEIDKVCDQEQSEGGQLSEVLNNLRDASLSRDKSRQNDVTESPVFTNNGDEDLDGPALSAAESRSPGKPVPTRMKEFHVGDHGRSKDGGQRAKRTKPRKTDDKEREESQGQTAIAEGGQTKRITVVDVELFPKDVPCVFHPERQVSPKKLSRPEPMTSQVTAASRDCRGSSRRKKSTLWKRLKAMLRPSRLGRRDRAVKLDQRYKESGSLPEEGSGSPPFPVPILHLRSQATSDYTLDVTKGSTGMPSLTSSDAWTGPRHKVKVRPPGQWRRLKKFRALRYGAERRGGRLPATKKQVVSKTNYVREAESDVSPVTRRGAGNRQRQHRQFSPDLLLLDHPARDQGQLASRSTPEVTQVFREDEDITDRHPDPDQQTVRLLLKPTPVVSHSPGCGHSGQTSPPRIANGSPTMRDPKQDTPRPQRGRDQTSAFLCHGENGGGASLYHYHGGTAAEKQQLRGKDSSSVQENVKEKAKTEVRVVHQGKGKASTYHGRDKEAKKTATHHGGKEKASTMEGKGRDLALMDPANGVPGEGPRASKNCRLM